MSNLVSISRGEPVEVKLFDTKGGIVKLYPSPTTDQQTQTAVKHGVNAGGEDPAKKMAAAYDSIISCFIEWNLGHEGVALECTAENIAKLTQRDFLLVLQACTGQQLVDTETGRVFTPEEVVKKGKGA